MTMSQQLWVANGTSKKVKILITRWACLGNVKTSLAVLRAFWLPVRRRAKQKSETKTEPYTVAEYSLRKNPPLAILTATKVYTTLFTTSSSSAGFSSSNGPSSQRGQGLWQSRYEEQTLQRPSRTLGPAPSRRHVSR